MVNGLDIHTKFEGTLLKEEMSRKGGFEDIQRESEDDRCFINSYQRGSRGGQRVLAKIR